MWGKEPEAGGDPGGVSAGAGATTTFRHGFVDMNLASLTESHAAARRHGAEFNQ